MNESTKTRALRAAAKLATGFALGCGGLAATEPAQDSGTISQDSAPHTSTSTSLTCGLATDSDGGLLASEVQCCLDLTTARVPVTTEGEVDAAAWRTDPSLKGCCEGLAQSPNLIAYEYEDAGGRAWPEQACQACADTIDNRSACTPWGPPVPPSMPDEVSEVGA